MKKFKGPRKRVARGAWLGGLCVALWGCGSGAPQRSQESPDPPPLGGLLGLDSANRGAPLTVDERDQVLSILRVQGVDVADARYFTDDSLLVEGDILVDARSVLRRANDEIEKGYFWNNVAKVSGYRDIHVVADPRYPVSSIWTMAFVYGGANWNANTRVIFTTAAPPTGATVLTVRAGDFGPTGLCYLAFTQLPVGGQPGIVQLNTGYHYGPGGCTDSRMQPACRVASLDSLTWDQMVHTAAHEMGHALGFGHPADASQPATLIPGTQSAANPDAPSYLSMMWGGVTSGCYPGNANVTLGLSADDILSSNKKYP